MNRKDWTIVITLSITLSTAVFGGAAWVESRLDGYVRRDTLAAYMEQVLTRLQSIEEALR